MCQVKPVPVRASLNVRKRRNPAGLTPSAGAPGAALASDPHTVGADQPPGWHGLSSYIHYYNRRPVLACVASRRDGVIWYRWSASGRVYVLQRGAGGIIAAFVGLVSWAVERVQSQEKPL